MNRLLIVLLIFCSGIVQCQFIADAPGRWPIERANSWYTTQPLLVGANYAPAYAINQLEMFQAETFDLAAIDRELALAEGIGMNTMRVFLHDLLWQQDAAGFTKRLDQFLAVCAKHHIRPMLVLFDSCWYPFPKSGKQPDPIPGIHNSGWMQAPGAAALTDVSQYPRLEAYVRGVVGAFRTDNRILAWDLWNEPDNTNESSYGAKSKKENLEPANKVAIVTNLLPQVFGWARVANPNSRLRRASGSSGAATGRTRQHGAGWTAFRSAIRTLLRFTSMPTRPHSPKHCRPQNAGSPADLYRIHGAGRRQ